jgi:hypothetical protein
MKIQLKSLSAMESYHMINVRRTLLFRTSPLRQLPLLLMIKPEKKLQSAVLPPSENFLKLLKKESETVTLSKAS